MKKFAAINLTVGILTVGIFLLTSTAFAQEENVCDPTNSVSLSDFLDNINTLCCDKASKKKRAGCLLTQLIRLRAERSTIGEELINEAMNQVRILRQNDCGQGDPLPECSDATSTSLTEVDLNAEESCCSKKSDAARRRCLNKGISALKSGKKGLGPDFSAKAITVVKTIKTENCGFEKTKPTTTCDKYASNSDGLEGWLHKPVSDSTGSIVNLWPTQVSPTGCRYEKSNGKFYRRAYNSGRHNGYRAHIRPVGGGSCSSFPKNLVINCKIGSKRICHRIPNACQRYD